MHTCIYIQSASTRVHHRIIPRLPATKKSERVIYLLSIKYLLSGCEMVGRKSVRHMSKL